MLLNMNSALLTNIFLPSNKCLQKQVLITQAFTNATQYEKDSRRWKAITATICYNIAKDMAPIATVEHSGFKQVSLISIIIRLRCSAPTALCPLCFIPQ